MLDGKQIRAKLIGSDDERAVSPVIGVILMVAITVILAAVIAAFVMDMGQGQEEPVQAAVDVEVTDSDGGTDDGEVKITITDAGNADEFEVRGSDSLFQSGSSPIELGISDTGQSVTLEEGATDELASDKSGDLNVVGVKGDSETVVASFSIDFNQ